MPDNQQYGAAFTTKANGRLRTLSNEVTVSSPFLPGTPAPDFSNEPKFSAIWDTGATNSVISSTVVSRCGLSPIGRSVVRGVHGEKEVDVYLVSLCLAGNIAIPEVRTTIGDIGAHDILIGMDIIGIGDFAVTNLRGQTAFSFRVPSLQLIDFVNQPAPGMGPASSDKIGRNAKCPCGSGKKYKKCCGKP